MAINAKLPDNMTPHAKELYDKCDLLSSENDLPEIIRLLEEAMSECPDSNEIIIREWSFTKMVSFGLPSTKMVEY